MAPIMTGFWLLQELPGATQYGRPFQQLLLRLVENRDEIEERLYLFATSMTDLIKFLEPDEQGRVSASSYLPLFNHMRNNNDWFRPGVDHTGTIRNFRKWIESYYLWSRTSPGISYGQEDLKTRSLVSSWFVEESDSAMDPSSRTGSLVMSINTFDIQVNGQPDFASTLTRVARSEMP